MFYLVRGYIVFINHSNHPSAQWDEAQKNMAENYGPILDIAFPIVNPDSTVEEVENLVSQYGKDILEKHPTVVMVQGEFTYTYKMVDLLKKHGVKVVAATSERIVKTLDDGKTKQVEFTFVQFREF